MICADVRVAPEAPVLQVGDKLRPTPMFLDIAKWKQVTLPYEFIFWRTRKVGNMRVASVLQRNPILDFLDQSPAETMCIDTLHALYLGPIKHFIAWVLHLVLDLNPWRLRGGKEGREEQGVNMLLQGYLEHCDKTAVDVSYRLRELTPGMLNARGFSQFRRRRCRDRGCLATGAIFVCKDEL